MLRLWCGVALLAVTTCGLTAQQAPPQSQQSAGAVTVHPQNFATEIRKTVGFLQVDYRDGETLKQISGTCFFVIYEDARLGKDRGFSYLVTNRHMAVPGVEKGLSYPVQQVSLFLNFKSPPDGGRHPHWGLGNVLPWAFPEDESVDLAVLPLAPSHEIFDYRSIPISFIATKDRIESEGLSPGDSVVFAGYFYQWPGDKKIQPIVRQGVLAMMPDEEIKTTMQKLGHIYLADAHAFHGNSGSPLFVSTGGIRGNSIGVASYLLLGVISGYYPEGESFSVPAATVLTGEVHDNSGIATVVPGYELKALLDSPRLQAQRDAAVAAEQKTKP